MLKMNVSNMCKEVHRVRVLYVHVFVSVYNFLRWNKIIKYKKKKKAELVQSCVTNPKPPRMMSSSANDRPFLSSFRHIPHRKVLYS